MKRAREGPPKNTATLVNIKILQKLARIFVVN